MNVEELRALSRRVRLLSAAELEQHGCEHADAYNDVVSRFREGVSRALNNLSLFEFVEPGLQSELRLLAMELPCTRCKAEAICKVVPPGSRE